MSEADGVTLFEAVGGQEFFDRLVDAFYRGVSADEVLLPLYPEAPDLGGARRRLALFLGQYWGGPTTYSDERGHPRLRMRHAPYPVGPEQRDRWLANMRAALESVDPPDEARDALWDYFVRAAEHLRNDTGLSVSPTTAPR